ncbi:MAG: SDR family oxidoreductase [Ginsengibacter sp.]
MEKTKNVLITGCSTGIGYAIAETFARNGYHVYATMRNPQTSPALAELAKNDNLPLTVLVMDVDNEESVKSAVKEVMAKAGQIDILVNNAGIGFLGSVEELSLEFFQATMQTNYFGALRCIQAVLPGMRKRESGHIINITSVAGIIYSPCHGSYSASKAALEALSESLAGEVGRFGIKVAVVEPGVIDTPIITKLDDRKAQSVYPGHVRMDAYLKASASHHVMPSEVAETVLAIANGQKASFRNSVGADAEPLLNWRASVSDEDWIASGSIDDDTWVAGMEQMGMNVRAFM